ncbi:MAG: hypothetical protein QM811_04880 [Pirellulales bacterium]
MTSVKLGIPMPAFTTALSYYDGYRQDRLPANLLQAQRDYFVRTPTSGPIRKEPSTRNGSNFARSRSSFKRKAETFRTTPIHWIGVVFCAMTPRLALSI